MVTLDGVNDVTIKEAYKHLRGRKPQEAVKALLAIPEEKQTYFTHSLVGQIYFRGRSFKKARPHLEKSVQKLDSYSGITDSERARVHSMLGYTYQKLGMLESSLTHHQKTVDYISGDVVAWCNLGNIYIELKRYEDAGKAFEKGEKINAKYDTVIVGLGKVSYLRKDYSRASKLFNRLITKSPRNYQGYLGLGKAYLKMSKPDEGNELIAKSYFLRNNNIKALDYLDKIENLMANKDRYQFYIACLLSEKLYTRAEKEIKRGVQKFPKDPQFLVNMAQLHYSQKSYQKVISVATTGIKSFPDSHPLHVMAANAYSKLSQKNKAIRHYDTALELNPDDLHARNRLAQLYREKKKKDDEFFHQGVVYFYTGDFRQAKEVLGWVKKDYSKPAQLKYYQGMVYWALKENEKGVEYLKGSIRLKGDYHLPYLALSEAYQARDQKDKAQNILKTYMDKYPESRHIKQFEEKIIELKKRK